MTVHRQVKRRQRPIGPQSSALKYDILTALGAFACRGDKHVQRRTLRFMTLITARYDWRYDKLTTGQGEIARLWSVDPRTVKREMARLREQEWLWLRQPSAKGRVACYGLGIEPILRDTRQSWGAVGPDLEARLSLEPIVPSNVVPLQPVLPETGIWREISALFQSGNPSAYPVWIAPLRWEEGETGPCLRAPSQFHASYVDSHYGAELARLARHVGARDPQIVGPDA